MQFLELTDDEISTMKSILDIHSFDKLVLILKESSDTEFNKICNKLFNNISNDTYNRIIIFRIQLKIQAYASIYQYHFGSRSIEEEKIEFVRLCSEYFDIIFEKQPVTIDIKV
jgi:hypothetical protein